MATAKKTTAKTSSAKPKTTTTKKAPVKKAPAKKAVARKTPVSKNHKNTDYESFQLATETEDFMTVRLNMQTIYWIILGIISIAFAWYTMSLTMSINDLYDQIDQIRAQDDSIVIPPAKVAE
jgi:hypothetical protein